SVLALIGALSPPVARDSLVYHLSLPKLYLAIGSWQEIPQNIYSYFPGFIEALYTAALATGNVYPALVHFGFGLACLLATRELGQILGLQRKFMLLCLIALVATPTFWSEMTWAYVDLGNTFFWLLAVIAFLRWAAERKQLWLILLGFSLGAAYGCKYTSLLLFMLVPLGLLLELRLDKNVSPGAAVKTLAIPLTVGLLTASPWWLRNIYLTGNPFFPFFWHLFPSHAPAWDGDRADQFAVMLETYGGLHKGLTEYLLAPFRVFITAEMDDPVLYDGKLGWYYLLALPLVFFWRKQPRNIQYIMGMVVIYLIYWTLSSQQARFLLVILPLLSVLVALQLQTLTGSLAERFRLRKTPGRKNIARLLLTGTVVSAIGLNSLNTVSIFRQERYLDYVLGNETKEEYLQRKLYYYDMYQFINTRLPLDADLLLVATGNQGYYLERRFFSDAIFEEHTLLTIISESQSGQEVVQKVGQRGWTHLLIRLDYFIKSLEPDFQGEKTKKFHDFINSLQIINISKPFYLFKIPSGKNREVN
ncbi:MAG: hypothetical protein R3297_10880, partial [Desulfobulbales bacterium]|nr:hypothetical protein [Desulfobulbales bacterium]